MRNAFRVGACAAMLVLVLLLGFVLTLIFARNRTPPILAQPGQEGLQSVAELQWRTIGGVEQSLLIRGRDISKPVALFVHGGPGMPIMYLAHDFQRSLEDEFVVVQWDRRGAGKSYDSRLPLDHLTSAQLLSDTVEVSQYLRDRFGQRPILLIGHSWGTYIGLRAAEERPDLYLAYVGIGQMSDADPLLAQATQRSLIQAAAHLRGLSDIEDRMRGADAPTEEDMFRTGGELLSASTFLPLIWIGMFAPEYSLQDIANIQKGSQLWMQRVRGERPDQWFAAHGQFEVPIYFFLGRYDSNTPGSLAMAYLDRIQAPDKRAYWFEQSAHFPFLEQPTSFATALTDVVTRAGNWRNQR